MKHVIPQLVFFIFIIFRAAAQDQQTDPGFGAHPNGQNWRILKSPAIRVIYPEGMEAQAQRIANIINLVSDGYGKSVGKKRYRFDLVLQNRTTIPNGFVALSPARSELFCTPPAGNQLLGSLDWLDVLSIHEYRHILQIANTRRGLTKFGSFIAGQRLWSVLNAINIPNWYMEGDAVISETSLTGSGRGRSSFFTNEFRTLAHEHICYNYLKLRNGSFKSFLPNQYPLGYLMLTKVRNEKGNEVTANVLKDASRFNGLFYPFSKAMKRHTGYSTVELYRQTICELNNTFESALRDVKITPSTNISRMPKRTVTKYQSPRFLSDGSIISIKSSYKRIESLVHISRGKEKSLCNIGANWDNYLTVGKDIAAWTEFTQDPRRPNLNYAEIVLFNTKTKTKTRLTRRTRYFSPVVSNDGKRVAAIHVSREQKCAIHILDAHSGKVLQQIQADDHVFLSRLAWLSDHELATISKVNSRLTLVAYDLNGGAVQELTSQTAHVMNGLSVHGSDIYFHADFSGIDNIYKTSVNGKRQIDQVTAVPVGAYEPDISPDGQQLVYSEINSKGFALSGAASTPIAIAVKIEEPAAMSRYQTVANRSEGGDILQHLPDQVYRSKSYNSLFRGLKIHSWSVSPSFSAPSAEIRMNNILNDVAIVVGGGINRNEGGRKMYSAEIAVGRYFPEIKLRGLLAQRSTDAYSSGGALTKRQFDELMFGASAAIPLTWVKHNMTSRFKATLGYMHRSLTHVATDNNSTTDRTFGSCDVGLSYSTLKRRALQQVGPRLGFAVQAQYVKALHLQAGQLSASARVYLPGITANHQMVFKTAYQKESLNNLYQYADYFEYPRGFTRIVNDDVLMYSVGYGLPLFYPDWGLAGITYFKRIRANLFYDAAIARRGGIKTPYSSAGVEFIFDNIHMNILPLSFGIRSSYLLQGAPTSKHTNMSIYVATDL